MRTVLILLFIMSANLVYSQGVSSELLKILLRADSINIIGTVQSNGNKLYILEDKIFVGKVDSIWNGVDIVKMPIQNLKESNSMKFDGKRAFYTINSITFKNDRILFFVYYGEMTYSKKKLKKEYQGYNIIDIPYHQFAALNESISE